MYVNKNILINEYDDNDGENNLLMVSQWFGKTGNEI